MHPATTGSPRGVYPVTMSLDDTKKGDALLKRPPSEKAVRPTGPAPKGYYNH